MANFTKTTTIALPEELQNKIIQKTQEDSAIMALAQKVNLPGLGASIPVILGDPEAEWAGEGEARKVSNPSLSMKHMGAYTLSVIVPFSNQFRNNVPALYSAIVQRLPRALAKKFDATALGAGTAPGDKFDTLKGIQSQAFGEDIYAALVAADADIAEHDGITNGFIISPTAKGKLLGAVDATGRPLFINSVAEGAVPMILGAPTKQTKAAKVTIGEDDQAVTNIAYAGDWTQAAYGVNGGVQISVSDQATIAIGEETINLWQRGMFAVMATIECGFVCEKSCFNAFTA